MKPKEFFWTDSSDKGFEDEYANHGYPKISEVKKNFFNEQSEVEPPASISEQTSMYTSDTQSAKAINFPQICKICPPLVSIFRFKKSLLIVSNRRKPYSFYPQDFRITNVACSAPKRNARITFLFFRLKTFFLGTSNLKITNSY